MVDTFPQCLQAFSKYKPLTEVGNSLVNRHLYVVTVQVDLYEVLDSRVKPWRGNLITSRLVPLYTQGWEVFNVTQTVTPSFFYCYH